MKPGRELDALVAERVMGWTRVEPKYLTESWREDVVALIAPGAGPGNAVPRWERAGRAGGPNTEIGDPAPPRYSTNITDAWKVVEQVALLHVRPNRGQAHAIYGCAVECEGRGTWRASFGIHSAESTTAPHAICVAALKAVGNDE